MPTRDLYNKLLIDHYKSTEHRYVPSAFTHSGTGYNHNCGDEVTIYLNLNGDTIADVSFEGKGCMISQASASMLAGELSGKTVDEANRVIRDVDQLLKGLKEPSEGDPDYAALISIRDFPMRMKCVRLPWDTVAKLLNS
jgi:nitrogen fixation protein NifU and related proteins